MQRILLISTIIACLSIPGCKTVKDLVSWTPFWWVINKKLVEHPGGLRKNPPVISARNYTDNKNLYRYSLSADSIILYRMEPPAKKGTPLPWGTLPGGNPRGCDGKLLKIALMAADNNRLFVVAVDKRGTRSLWWYTVKKDQAVWAMIMVNAVGDFMRKGYKAWIDCAHGYDSTWVNLLALREFVPYVEPRLHRISRDSVRIEPFNAPRMSIDVNDIVDIAVGHWPGTVVTLYVLMGSTGKIMYIDEEIVMDRWKEVPNLPFVSNHPYPLGSTARIAASNSVIATYYIDGKSGDARIAWIRWDFHNYQDFEYFPLNWCESEWHYVSCPVQHADYFSLDSHWPDARDSIWETPEGIMEAAETINKLVPREVGKRINKKDWRGFLGGYAKKNISAYRVRFEVTKGDSIHTLDLENMDYDAEKTITPSNWKTRQQ